MKSKVKWIFKHKIILIIIVSILSRLPLLLSENLFLDGDECIVGLMAKHFTEGKGVPIFFYGQSYGFSLFEIIPISISYSIFGISEIIIKITMLCLWIIGIVLFYKTLEEIGYEKNKWAPLLITLVFVFMPSFAIWSMKARGGYLTAFLLSSAVMYFLFNKKWKNSLFISFVAGLTITIIYQSQALWLAGLIPIIAYVTFKKKKPKYNIILATGIVFGIFIFSLLKANLSTFWSPVVINWSNLSLKTLFSIPEQVYFNMMGSYHYFTIINPVIITKILAVTFTVIIFSTLIAGAFFFRKKKKNKPSVLHSMHFCFFYYRISSFYEY